MGVVSVGVGSLISLAPPKKPAIVPKAPPPLAVVPVAVEGPNMPPVDDALLAPTPRVSKNDAPKIFPAFVSPYEVLSPNDDALPLFRAMPDPRPPDSTSDFPDTVEIDIEVALASL